jgi:DNA-binding FrmR family transcriptional regulator
MMNTEHLKNKDDMLRRLARAEGQLRGVQKMLRQGNECEKVMQQLSAARKAMDKAYSEMIACVIEHGITDACPDKHQASETVSQLRTLLLKYS